MPMGRAGGVPTPVLRTSSRPVSLIPAQPKLSRSPFLTRHMNHGLPKPSCICTSVVPSESKKNTGPAGTERTKRVAVSWGLIFGSHLPLGQSGKGTTGIPRVLAHRAEIPYCFPFADCTEPDAAPTVSSFALAQGSHCEASLPQCLQGSGAHAIFAYSR